MKSLVLIALALGGLAASAKCVDGQRSMFNESNPYTDQETWVWRTCKNGSYYPKSTVTPTRCKEGRQTIFTETDPWNPERERMVVRTCKNGRYYPKSEVKISRCKEGRRMIETLGEEGIGGPQQIVYVCENGKYKRVN